MKRIIKTILILLLFIFSVLFMMVSVKNVEKGKVYLVEDLNSGKIVSCHREGYNFIWMSVIPWQYSVYEVSLNRSLFHEVLISIPSLQNLKGDFYSIRVPVNLVFKIDPERIIDISKLDNNLDLLYHDLKRIANGLFASEMNKFIFPVYSRKKVYDNFELVFSKTESGLKKSCNAIGIDLVAMERAGVVSAPDNRNYVDGLRHLSAMRELEKENEKQVSILKNRLIKQKLSDSQLYAKLYKMSEIIKNNPDILRYMFIEKMADNVRVIVSQDNKLLPAINSLEHVDKKSGDNREIDNLK